MRIVTIYAKTVADLAKPKLLAGYFVPLVAITAFVVIALSNGVVPSDAPLFQQEAGLFEGTLVLAYLLAVGMPLQAVCAVFCAVTIGAEAEKGTLRILLSKPVKRWQLYVGTFAAIVSYALVVGLVGLLVSSTLLVVVTGVDAAAIGVGVFAALPGSILFGLLGAVVVTSVGLLLAVVTKDRLRTALGALAIPVLFFIFIPVQLFAGDVYEDYSLYLVDLNYHFGHAFALLHGTVGGGLRPSGQRMLATFANVYESPDVIGHTPQSFELTGHVSPTLSVGLLTGVAAVSFVAGLYRFQRIDV